MSLLEQINQNKRRTNWLMLGAFVVLGVLGAILGLVFQGDDWLSMTLAFLFGAGIYLVFNYFYSAHYLMNINHANEIQRGDPQYQQLFNIVDEVAQLADIPVPRVFVINDGTQNAFATGRDVQHGQIAVTTGLLAKMNRDELTGVIAHEMSHIKNYDVRLSTIATGISAVISGTGYMLFRFGESLLWSERYSRSDDSDSKGSAAVGGVMMLVGGLIIIIGIPVVRAVQYAIGRQRESLADVSAAELTRNPQGLIDALTELKSDNDPMDVINQSTAALFFSEPVSKSEAAKLNDDVDESAVPQTGWFDKLWMTHPPLDERIARLKQLIS